jgi:hypothetical protein
MVSTNNEAKRTFIPTVTNSSRRECWKAKIDCCSCRYSRGSPRKRRKCPVRLKMVYRIIIRNSRGA